MNKQHKNKVLIVEDEFAIALSIQQTLHSLDYEAPEIVASGKDAIQQVEALKPDLVLMDIVLVGDMDGIEAAGIIRLKWGVPVIYLTSYSDEETIKRAKLTIPFGYIIKPFQKKDLHITIELALYRDKMEKQLQQQKEWLSAVLNNVGEAVVATNEKGAIQFLNPLAIELLEEDEVSVDAKPLSNIMKIRDSVSGETVQFETPQNQKIMTSHNRFNVMLVKSSGDQCPIDLIHNPIFNINKHYSGSVYVIRDNSERKHNEAVLIEQQKRAELGEMSSSIAHEINSPLGFICLTSGVVKNLIGEEGEIDKQVLNQHIEKIESTSQVIGNIVTGLTRYARDSSQDPFKKTLVLDIIKETLSLCVKRFKHPKLKIHVPKENIISIECRPTQIMQVFMNILNNSIDAVSSLAEQWIKFEISEQSENVTISVIDSGTGIPEHIRDKVLTSFFTTKSSGKGTGIGLSISKSIVENHNGAITINHDGPNTEFIVV